MDTKWNNMENNPGKELEYYVAGQIRKTLEEDVPPGVKIIRPGRRVKALIGFLAFFLGVTLVFESLGAIGSQILWERDLSPRFTKDWQETDNFHNEVSQYLKDFLVLGAGGQLDFYNDTYWEEYDGGLIDKGYEMGTFVTEAESNTVISAIFGAKPYGYATSGSTSGFASPIQEPQATPDREPDADYQADKNILYIIQGGTGEDRREYKNTTGSVSFFEQRMGEDYNFYLIFSNGKVQIWKDGEELDVYGNGFYNEDSKWFVPGYDNFPASEQLDGVYVYMAVRKDPIRYYGVDYQTGSNYYNSSMYYIAQWVKETQRFYRTQAALFGVGVLLLCIWFFLRRETQSANAKIASWTLHIWTEARFLIGVILVGFLFFGFSGDRFTDLYYSLRDFYWYWNDSNFFYIGTNLLRLLLSNLPILITLVWFLWLIRNDHRYNAKEVRRSLLRPFFRAVRARSLKRPIEKRVSRMAGISAFAVLFLEMEVIFFLILHSIFYYNPLPSWSLWTLFLLPVLAAAAITVYHVRRQCQIAEDIGRLADQVESVRAGDLSNPLDLPKDADLHKTAESLNDIQAGMKAALAEQTRSERMKVELVSNVSHDLKTPLTSILSYAELLRQEELPPVAADYARIIDEKAQRLKGMVQDVFEVSKAAADQLPVHLEHLDLAKLLRQTLADLDGPIQKSALMFKIDLPEEPVMIRADGKRLYRVFQNLIDNALRYALEGSRVYLTLKVTDLAEVSVRNTSKTELPEGVDFTARFVRGDSSRTDGGSGLGLSIVSSFTEACGGSFKVETVADLFTAVVSFPLA